MKNIIQLFLFVALCTLTPSCRHSGDKKHLVPSPKKSSQKPVKEHVHPTNAHKKRMAT
jgi:hypothetical protein